ncbi:SpoIIE family protein phosphatase [Geodermatophilus sp. YIM 151500]|uniref:SpoIIE family protein phosphatase n=1 Tax=Geodermatophilus sp. YIM 151500 TaxID=2984531 RepID=UPI0021E41687|nr:SpoIIE family protein phosphatase [Geodermatophilus sp. YIM 151500]MCV2490687.1 SpoIIE family protein phosphatase [Geodermatophilus sp. YIM 151500]
MLTTADGAPLLEALPDAVVVADAAGQVVYANAAVAALLGHPPGDLVGHPLTVLMPERFRSAHRAGFGRFLATGRGELVGSTTQVPGLHADGHEVTVDLTLARIADGSPDGGIVVGVLRDASTTVLLERQMQVSRYLAAILRVTTALAEAPDADAAFHLLLPTLCDQLDWDAASLWRPDEHAGALHYAGTWNAPGEPIEGLQAETLGRTFRPGEGLPGLVWRERIPVAIGDLWSDPRFLRQDAARADGVHTGVAFPVLHGNVTLAVVELFSRRSRPIPSELLAVLAAAGRQIGQFLGRLRAESEARRLADTLQRSLLPSRLPEIPGVQLAARYHAGGERSVVGGDTYDVMPLPDGGWMVLIADVCGTGAGAAASTALTRHTARAVAAAGGPADVLAAVDAALQLEQGPGAAPFVTACCLLLRPRLPGATGRLALAGHPQPLLRRAAGTVTALGHAGVPLGLGEGAGRLGWPETGVRLAAGDTLVLYTDGVTEARDAGGRQFGEAGLCAVLERTADLDAESTVEAVAAAVAAHADGSQRASDDLAVLALRC